jgi:hypothetical protein
MQRLAIEELARQRKRFMPSAAKWAKAVSGTAISPVAQLWKENRPGRNPRARRFEWASEKWMRTMLENLL